MAKNLSRFQAGRLSTKDLYNYNANSHTSVSQVIGVEQFFASPTILPPTIIVRRRGSEVISS
jgi:hypothetical protein